MWTFNSFWKCYVSVHYIAIFGIYDKIRLKYHLATMFEA